MEKTSDLSDRASLLEELETQTRINAVRAAAKQPVATPTGECLQCGEGVSDGRRWCDADCRDDWEIEYSRRKRRG